MIMHFHKTLDFPKALFSRNRMRIVGDTNDTEIKTPLGDRMRLHSASASATNCSVSSDVVQGL